MNFGGKYNYEIFIDSNSKCGLKGFPAHLETMILNIFKKEEIISNPHHVLECFF
jgi:hypothetical protein